MMNFVQLPRGGKVTTFSGITATATSVIQECKDHNAIILFAAFIAGAGTFTIKIQGRVPGTDTFVDMYDVNDNLMGLSAITASKARFFAGIPEQFRVVATEDADGATITVAYQLISV